MRGDPASMSGTPRLTSHDHHPLVSPTITVSDSSLKFTHILYNLSPAGKNFKLKLSHIITNFENYRIVNHDVICFHLGMNTELYEQAIKYEKGSFISSSGALATLSGAKTGRSPKDKRVVRDETTEHDLWWGK